MTHDANSHPAAHNTIHAQAQAWIICPAACWEACQCDHSPGAAQRPAAQSTQRNTPGRKPSSVQCSACGSPAHTFR